MVQGVNQLAMAQADPATIRNVVLHDAIAFAALAGLQRSSGALLGMASPAH